MWTTNYIISQVFALAFIGFYGATFFTKNKKLVLILYNVASICLGLQYFFLKAYTGMISSFVSIIATLWYLANDKMNRHKDYTSIIATSIIYLVVGIIFYQGWVDILVIIASITFNYAMWQDNIFVYRIIGAIVSLFWLIYDIFYFTILQMISDVILFVVKIVGLTKLVIETKKINKNKQ